MTLADLIDLARSTNPGLRASAAVTDASRAQVTEAWTNWLPSGSLLSLVAPSPQVHCIAPPGLTPPPGVSDAEFAKAGKSWISAVSQNFTLGLGEARDLSDALNAFFQMRARYLQAVFDLNVAASTLARATGTSDM